MGDDRYMGPGVCFGGFGEEFDAGLDFLMEKKAFFVDSFDFGLISLVCCSGVSLLYHRKSQFLTNNLLKDTFLFGTFSKHKTVANPRCDWTWLCFEGSAGSFFEKKHGKPVCNGSNIQNDPWRLKYQFVWLRLRISVLVDWFDLIDWMSPVDVQGTSSHTSWCLGVWGYIFLGSKYRTSGGRRLDVNQGFTDWLNDWFVLP